MKIKKIIVFLLVREVKNKIVYISKYTLVTIYMRNTVHGNKRTIYLIIKVYIIDNLKVNILIDTNTIASQGIIINLDRKIITFAKCQNLQVSLNIITRTQPYFKRIIRFKSAITIALDTTIEVSIVYNNKISNNRDFLFELDCS